MAQFTFTFRSVPNTLEELKALPEADLQSGFKTVALTLLALMGYEKNPTAVCEMIDFLNGPDPFTPYEQNQLKDRLRGKQYKVGSFFAGATPANGYTPSFPLTITVFSNPYSFKEENYGTIYVRSSGADTERPVKIRKKPSTGQWFITDITFLSDIRLPVAQDQWA